jgi:beta-lactamase regulating signal transducer with metallopeptidase domain
MSELLRLILSNALAAGLLALAAWAVSRRVRRQSLVHGLWVLALIKLVTPPIVPLPLLPGWTLPSLGLPDGPAVVVVEPGTTARPDESPPDTFTAGTPAWTVEEGLLPASGPAGARSAPLPETALTASVDLPSPVRRAWAPASLGRGVADLAPLAWFGFLAGALVVAVLAAHRIRRFRRLLRLGVPPSPTLLERVAELARHVGLRRAPPVLVLPARVPPMLWPGRRGPLLLLPAGLLPELSDEELDTLLVHELAHVRRRDHWVRLLELAATVLFWWYPVTWWVRRALRRAEERCCDEWVLRVMPDSAGAYADGLLKSLDLVAGEPDPLPVGASGAGPVGDLEARLKEILMSNRPSPTLATPVRLAFAAVALLGLAVFPTQAQQPEPPPGPEPALAPTPEAAPEPPAAPAPAEVADTSPPSGPVAPAPPPTTAPADPAPVAEVPSPELVVPAPPAPPEAPAPVVAPRPHPRPVVTPAPVVPRVAAVPPAPAPHPAPQVLPGPPASVAAPSPVVVPSDPEESPDHEAARREFEEQERKLEEQRVALRQRELELARERMEREARAQQEEMRKEAERLRAIGDAERAALVDEQARATARRRHVQQRELALEQARLAEQMKREQALRTTTEELRTLEREGQEAEAVEVRERLMRLEEEHTRRLLELDEKRVALQREVMENEHQAQLAEMKLAEKAARRGHEEMQADLERNRERQKWEYALQQREGEAQAAAQALQAKEREAHALDAEGRHDEAQAARAEAERMRQKVESLQRDIQEEHLLRATSELELQIESQIAALRHIQGEGATDAAEVQERIERLQAALAALRDTEH